MGGAAIGLVAVSTLYGAASSRKAGRENQQIAEQNAAIGRLQAKDVLKISEQDVGLIRKQKNFIKGEQAAAFAGQGIDLGSGVVSAIDINTDMEIENEILTVRNNAAKRAWGLQVGAQQDVFQGQVARRQGNAQAIGTLLGGAADIAVIGSQLKD